MPCCGSQIPVGGRITNVEHYCTPQNHSKIARRVKNWNAREYTRWRGLRKDFIEVVGSFLEVNPFIFGTQVMSTSVGE